MEFSSITKKILIKAGWFKGRKIDIKKIEDGLIFEGYKLNETMKKFLQEFGDLKIEYPMNSPSDKNNYFHFNSVFAARSVYKEVIEEHEKKTLEKLVVIGMAERDNMFIMMSETGIMYFSFEDDIFKIGENYIQAIENLCQYKQERIIKL